MSAPVDVLAVMDGATAAMKAAAEGQLRAALMADAYIPALNEIRAAVAELIDAAAYALRTRNDAGALSDTAEFNLRAALAACGVQP